MFLVLPSGEFSLLNENRSCHLNWEVLQPLSCQERAGPESLVNLLEFSAQPVVFLLMQTVRTEACELSQWVKGSVGSVLAAQNTCKARQGGL